MHIDSTNQYWEVLLPRYLPTDRLLPWDNFDPGKWFNPNLERHSCQFPASPGKHAAILDFDELQVCYEVDSKFRQWCLWNPEPHCGFICPEPMSWLSNAPNLNLPDETTGWIRLPANTSIEFISRIIIKK